MSGLEPLIIAKGIALWKAHVAASAVHTAATAAAAHVPTHVAVQAAVHVGQTGVQAAAAAPTVTQVAVTLGSTAGLAYGIASQGGGMVGRAQRKMGRHGIGNPKREGVETFAEESVVDSDVEMGTEQRGKGRHDLGMSRNLRKEPADTIIEKSDVDADLGIEFERRYRHDEILGDQRYAKKTASASARHTENIQPIQNPIPKVHQGKSTHNEDTLGRSRYNQNRSRGHGLRYADTWEDQNYSTEAQASVQSDEKESSLDFDGKFGRILFVFFRTCEIVLTLTTIGFISLSLQANDTKSSDWIPHSTYNGGSVFALIVTLWSLGFLIYRMIMAFKPALYQKAIALAMELITILLLFGGSTGIIFGLACSWRYSSDLCNNEVTANIVMWTLWGCYLFSCSIAHGRVMWRVLKGAFHSLFEGCTRM